MAVQDNPKFKEWEKANAELQKRKAYFEAAKVFPKKHALRQVCKKNLEEAQAAYDKIVSELE
jgi:hypothetical protein